MARNKAALLNELSTADLKQLLAARERIDVLEKERANLQAGLDKVETELVKLVEGVSGSAASAPRRKAGRPKGTSKKKTKKSAPGKKAAKKITARKKATVKKVVRKKTAKKVATRKKTTTKKKVARKVVGKKTGSRLKLEDVVVKVIRKRGGPVSYKDLFAAIVKGRMFASKSDNFDNVLRRTLSTSKKVKRVGRGIYNVA